MPRASQTSRSARRISSLLPSSKTALRYFSANFGFFNSSSKSALRSRTLGLFMGRNPCVPAVRASNKPFYRDFKNCGQFLCCSKAYGSDASFHIGNMLPGEPPEFFAKLCLRYFMQFSVKPHIFPGCYRCPYFFIPAGISSSQHFIVIVINNLNVSAIFLFEHRKKFFGNVSAYGNINMGRFHDCLHKPLHDTVLPNLGRASPGFRRLRF